MTAVWHPVAKCNEIEENDAIAVEIDNKNVAIYRSNGTYYATDNICTHANAPLVDGYLENGIIECPLHQGRFDISNGKALCSPATKNLNTYSIRVVDNEIQIKLE